MELKTISPDAVPAALELAERYRLLNEPEQAESICRDVLVVDPVNQLATRTLLLALSDQFGRKQSSSLQNAKEVAANLSDDYERHYFSGVMLERWARCKLQENQPPHMVTDWIQMAMTEFEQAEQVRPPNEDSALLRWNTCQRLLAKLPKRDDAAVHPEYGD